MFWLKACPRCHGDLYNSKDAYGSYIACLQCSRYLTPAQEAKLLLAAAGPEVWDNTNIKQEKRAAA